MRLRDIVRELGSLTESLAELPPDHVSLMLEKLRLRGDRLLELSRLVSGGAEFPDELRAEVGSALKRLKEVSGQIIRRFEAVRGELQIQMASMDVSRRSIERYRIWEPTRSRFQHKA